MEGNFYLDALVNGDSRIISKIYKSNFSQVQRFVMQNSGNKEDAEDVFQKALLQIAMRHKKEGIQINSSFDGFLFTVCKNLWRRELNRDKNRVTNSEVVELVSEAKDNAKALIEQKRQELFVEMLDKISENCKMILSLFFAKVPYAEIVATTEYTSETVVRQRVFKCKKKLTDLIKQDQRYHSLLEL
jgi:RNA polymerase sigma factor (sigma-70 family)